MPSIAPFGGHAIPPDCALPEFVYPPETHDLNTKTYKDKSNLQMTRTIQADNLI